MKAYKINIKNLFFISLLMLSYRTIAAEELLLLSVHPGIYGENKELSIVPLKKDTRICYGFLNNSSNDTETTVPFLEPLRLTAVQGEERHYKIAVRVFQGEDVLKTEFFNYTIDRRNPLPAEISVKGGEYFRPVKLLFSQKESESVFYSINGDIYDKPQRWQGDALILNAPAGAKKEYRIDYYSEDAAGNRSYVSTVNFTINHEEPYLKIMSPVDGEYANYQILYIEYKNIQWIKYTLDGSDPVENGIVYSTPALLKYSGNRSLRIAAKPKWQSPDYIRKKISINIKPEKKLSVTVDYPSGIYNRGLKISIKGNKSGRIYYTLSEKTPKDYDFLYSSGVYLQSIPMAKKLYTLRIRGFYNNGRRSGEYRYFYIINRRRPRKPVIEFSAEPPFNGRTKVTISTKSRDKIFYTLDGSSPDSHSDSYKGPFFISPEDAKNKRALTVKAVVINDADIIGDEAVKYAIFDTAPPAPPLVTVQHADGQNGDVVLKVKAAKDVRVLYEVSSSSPPPEIRIGKSPSAEKYLSVAVPYGMEKEFLFRFAAVDAAGNLTPAKNIIKIVIDKKPPDKPELTPVPGNKMYDHGISVGIPQIKGDVFYSLTDDGAIPDRPTERSKRLKEELNLNGIKSKLVHYQLKLLLRDKNGNISRVFGPYHYYVDKRKPVVPHIRDFDNGRLYTNHSVNITMPDNAPLIYYTFTDNGREPKDPDLNSPVIPGKLVFKGTDGLETEYRVKLLPVSSGGNIKGDIKKLSFVIDRKPPLVPALEGISGDAVYRKPVSVGVLKSEPGTKVFISYSTSESPPPDPLKYGEELKNKLVFDVEDGIEKTFKIRVTALDNAGNRSVYDSFYTFKIDKKPPENLVVSGFPSNGISNDAVVISMHVSGGTIYYSITDDGTIPQIPDRRSKKYESPFILNGKPEKEVTYRIIARAADRAGNFTHGLRINNITVDRKAPENPPVPVVVKTDLRNIRSVIWKVPEGNKIYYKFNDDYLPYNSPLTIKKTTTIEYYMEDRAGNRSPVKEYTVKIFASSYLLPPYITGVKSHAVYNHPVKIAFRTKRGTVHYEITLDGTEPSDVTIDSPAGSGIVPVNVIDGDTVPVKLKARVFDSNGNSSDISYVSFLLDRTAPEAPVITGIENQGHYQETKRISLLTDEGLIYYALSSSGKDPEIPKQTRAHRYKGEIVLPAENGKIKDYRIIAYTVDKAGNRSRDIPVWRIVIDNKIIYVSSGGNDLYEGTASKPLKSIKRAVELADQQSRRTIYIASGIYKLNRPLRTGNRTLTIRGGFAPDTWKVSRFQKTEITTGKYFNKGDALIILDGGKLKIINCSLYDYSGRAESLVSVSAGELDLKDDFLEVNGSSKVKGIVQTGGKVTVRNSELSVGKASAAVLIDSGNGDLYLTGTSLEGAVKQKDFTALKLFKNREVLMNGITINPGSGNNLTGIDAVDTNMKLTGSSVLSGSGSESAYAVFMRNTNAVLYKSRIKTLSSAAYPVAVFSENSRLTVSNTDFKVAGLYGATGLQIKGGYTQFDNNRIEGIKSQEYLYMINLTGNGIFTNNVISGGESGDFICIQLFKSVSSWFNNTIIGGTGNGFTIGFYVGEASKPKIVNNIIVREKASAGDGILFAGSKSVNFPIVTNDFTGWNNLIKIAHITPKKVNIYPYQNNIRNQEIKSIEKLNNLDKNPFGGIISGNITEDIEKTFGALKKDNYHLSKLSECINGGTGRSSKNNYKLPEKDFDGQSRPAPLIGIKPMYDIGADEFY
ncbi:MAG: hypothetical protein GXP33_13335 [Spirochaetes bacterium]|nr:hypothetical protein [Spirochaetota bacterium]